jgi:hypothetical protein
MLGATQRQLFQGQDLGGGNFNITGYQPYKAFGGTYDAAGNQTSYDPSKGIAGFQPMQTNAQQGVANMQVPGQYNQAMGITGQGIMGQLGTAGQGAGLSGMGYQAANAGNQYAMQATNPNATQAYMSPYMQNVVDVQQREAQRKADIAGTQRNAQAVQAGAFGGSRQAITDAEAARNLALQQGDIQATGLQSAFQQAQQAQQYGANLGLQGMQAGMQGVGAGIGAQQAAYGQAMSGAQNLAGLGQQQLAAQQGIYGLQNQYGGQQQAMEQLKLNQAQQDYANAQQYPLMQLGTMSNMIRGLPMQAQTTQQYQASPSALTQGIGAAGAAASLMGAFGGKAEGGVIKSMAKGGIASYDVVGEVEHDLYNMDEEGLQRQLKESSSQTIKRIAQRLLREKQMESQQRRPGMAGGGIVAFKTGNEVEEPTKPAPTSSEILQQRVMQGKPTEDITKQPAGIIQAAPPAPTPALTSLQAVQADPNIPDVLKAQISDQQTRMDRPLQDIMAEKKAMYAAAGLGEKSQEERANLMKERANAEDEATRNRYLQAAAFFARWGSTPGPTLVAGLSAVRDRIPDIIDNEKEAKKIRMDINKSIASLDEATRLEKRGEIDAAAAIKEKDAAKMQELYLKLADYEMAAKKEAAAEAKMVKQEELRAEREKERDNRLTTSHEKIAQAQIAGNLEVEKLRSKAENARIASASADRKDQAKWAQLTSMYKSSEAAISGINDIRNRKDYIANKAVVDRAEALKSIDPEGKVPPQFAATYPKALEKLNELEQEIAESKSNIQSRVRLYEKRIFGEDFDMSSNAPTAKPTGGADKKDRPPIDSFKK